MHCTQKNISKHEAIRSRRRERRSITASAVADHTQNLSIDRIREKKKRRNAEAVSWRVKKIVHAKIPCKNKCCVTWVFTAHWMNQTYKMTTLRQELGIVTSWRYDIMTSCWVLWRHNDIGRRSVGNSSHISLNSPDCFNWITDKSYPVPPIFTEICPIAIGFQFNYWLFLTHTLHRKCFYGV